MDDEEMWRVFERSDLADFIRPIVAEGPTVDLTFPEHLEFTNEQRAFIASLMSHVVEEVTYELSRKWARHMIDVLMAGDWQIAGNVEPAVVREPRDSPSSDSAR